MKARVAVLGALAAVVLAAPARACPLPVAYPGDGAAKDAIAQWMARGAMAAGLPGELPVMGALVESSLTNVAQGDRDAAGYFQTRVAVWDRPPYQDFPQHPELQLQWFVDLATQVRQADLAQGFDPLPDAAMWGNWIADVLVPAEQYRGRYQLRLAEARALIGPACPADAPPGGPQPAPTPSGAPSSADTTAPLAPARRPAPAAPAAPRRAARHRHLPGRGVRRVGHRHAAAARPTPRPAPAREAGRAGAGSDAHAAPRAQPAGAVRDTPGAAGPSRAEGEAGRQGRRRDRQRGDQRPHGAPGPLTATRQAMPSCSASRPWWSGPSCGSGRARSTAGCRCRPRLLADAVRVRTRDERRGLPSRSR